MKKNIKLLIIFFLFLPAVALAYFQPATLFKGNNRQAVYSKAQADGLFNSGYQLEKKEASLGVAIPISVANFETSLASALSGTATSSMTLVNGTTDDGSTLNGLYGFTLDSGSANQEYILANCVNTACSGLTRGISVITGSTNVPALQSYHLRGASVKITDHPILPIISRILNGNETTPGGLTFGTNAITGLATPNSASSTAAANVDYVNTSVTSGAPLASVTAKGIVEIATGAELAAGTATGSTGAIIVPGGASFKNSSAGAGDATKVPVLNASGKLDASFIELETSNPGLKVTSNKLDVKLNGSTISAGASGLAVNAGTSASQIVQLDGSAKLPAVDGSQLTGLNTTYTNGYFTNPSANGATTTITTNLGRVPKLFTVECFGYAGAYQTMYSSGNYNGSTYAYGYASDAAAGGGTNYIAYVYGGTYTATSTVTTFNATTVVLTWGVSGSANQFPCIWTAN